MNEKIAPRANGVYALTLAEIEGVCRVHRAVLPASLPVRLGPEFLTRFYYPRLLAMPDFLCGIYLWDGNVVGFIDGTLDSASLLRTMALAQPLRLAWIVLQSVLTQPRRLAVLWELLRALGGPRLLGTNVKPELLTFGVLPEYRSPSFYKRHRVKIANELFDYACATLRSMGAHEYKVFTGADDDALLINMFYQAQGLELRGTFQHLGLRSNLYVGQLDRSNGPSAHRSSHANE